MVECDAVLEICDSNRVRPEKKNNNNKDSTEIRKTIIRIVPKLEKQ